MSLITYKKRIVFFLIFVLNLCFKLFTEMENKSIDTSHQNIGFDLGEIIEAFELETPEQSPILTEWLNATGTLTDHEQWLFDRTYQRTRTDSGYWNEEELKIKFVGSIFDIVNLDGDNELKVFYERKLSANVSGYNLNVKADCLIARYRSKHALKAPLFFLQEFKKKLGEKNDPEAQMLTAMLIAQCVNNDNKPVFGGVLFGSIWQFATLQDKDYCLSEQFDGTKKEDLLQIIFILRKLKELILGTTI